MRKRGRRESGRPRAFHLGQRRRAAESGTLRARRHTAARLLRLAQGRQLLRLALARHPQRRLGLRQLLGRLRERERERTVEFGCERNKSSCISSLGSIPERRTRQRNKKK